MKEIILTIDPEGEVTIDANGFKGRACEDATRPLEKALGIQTERRRPKAEHRVTNSAHQRVQGGKP